MLNPVKPIVTLVVTRHPALVDFLRAQDWIPEGTQVIEHATADDVRDQHVLGVLPHHLSSLAASVTEVKLELPRELRGVELTLEQVAAHYEGWSTYTVSRVAGVASRPNPLG